MGKIIGIILVVIHLILLIWALGGMMEWLSLDVPWKPYSNPEFPHWLLLIHWSSVLFASSVFLFGYVSRWSRTPHYMAVGYGMMALVCVVETFGYMTSEFKYIEMGLEYTAYILILTILFNPSFRLKHFE